MCIYTTFISPSQLISPVNGYTCRRITKQNIKNFGFESIEELQREFPDFPLMCEEYQQTRKNVGNSIKFIESQKFQKRKFEEKVKHLEEEYENNPRICPKCSSPISFTKRNNQFCSRKCANSKQHTLETRKKISKSVIKNPGGFAKWTPEERSKYGKSVRKPRKTIQCLSCNKSLTVMENSNRIYCSRKCNPNHGGYRKGSGRSNGGYYKGIYCHSTYELVWVMYNIHHDIEFSKCNKHFHYIDENNKKRKYYPDFILDGDIIEIKGYYSKKVDLKADAVIGSGENIKILYKTDLDYAFMWFSLEYPDKKLNEMYENCSASRI